jgi:hypothetical protein
MRHQHHMRQSSRGNDAGGMSPTQYGHPSLPGVYSFDRMSEMFSVTNERHEVIKTSLYDSAPYPAAGILQLSFFQQGIGGGTGFGGATKTPSDTNMVTNGLLSAGISFLVQNIEIEIQTTTPTVAAQMPAAYGAQAAAALVNDAYIIGRSGYLRFEILSKPYLVEAPVGRFPQNADFDVSGALSDATTAAATQQNRLAFGKWKGDRYHLSPVSLLLASTMNFSITLNWPEGLQAITNPARIFVHLNGIEYRLSQ